MKNLTLNTRTETQYRAALKNKAADLYLVPTFTQATQAFLYYHDHVLDMQQLPTDSATLKRSGVKRKLLSSSAAMNAKPRFAGLEDFEHLWIIGDLVMYDDKEWFIAREIRVDDGEPSDVAPLTRILQLHVLHAKGFLTSLPLCSWATITGLNKKNEVQTQELPRTKVGVEKLFAQRVSVLNQVLCGTLQSYWSKKLLFTIQPKGRFGNGRVLPVDKIRGLELAGAVGTKSGKSWFHEIT